jgi:translation initiation factor IF-3
VKEKRTLVNNNIKARRIILIDEKGTRLGEFITSDALNLAYERGFDLVQVSFGDKPVCKIMDYGKLKYEQSKKQKNSSNLKTKEIKLGPMTEEHDIMVRVKNAERFLKAGHRVKVIIRFKGREHAHHDFGITKCNDFASRLEDTAVIETPPRLTGREVSMLLAPK